MNLKTFTIYNPGDWMATLIFSEPQWGRRVAPGTNAVSVCKSAAWYNVHCNRMPACPGQPLF